jgi:hypothetical protein
MRCQLHICDEELVDVALVQVIVTTHQRYSIMREQAYVQQPDLVI